MEPKPVDGIFQDLAKYASLLRRIAAAVRTQDRKAIFDAVLEASALLGFSDFANEAAELWAAFEKMDWSEIVDNLGDILKLIASKIKKDDPAPIRMMAVADDVPAMLEACAAVPVQSGDEPKPVENPLVIIALIGLAINIVRFIRERRKG